MGSAPEPEFRPIFSGALFLCKGKEWLAPTGLGADDRAFELVRNRTRTVELSIASDFAERGVTATLGVIEAAVSLPRDGAELDSALAAAVAGRTSDLADRPVAEIPSVAATRKAYKACGKDPSRYRPSAEALLRRVSQGKALYRINAVVDCNNLISLQTGLSIGAYDAAQLKPPVTLRIGQMEESYEGIGRGPINLAGLPLLADALGPFGSPTSDSERTMITERTERLLMVLFGFGAGEELAVAVETAKTALANHCSGQDITSRLCDQT